MNQEEYILPESQTFKLPEIQEPIIDFHSLPRKDKLKALKQAIKSTQEAVEAAVNIEQRRELYSDLGRLIMNLDTLKMNKYDSSYFSFTVHNGYNRSQRRKGI